MHSVGFINAEYALPHIRQLVLDSDPRRRSFFKSFQLLRLLDLKVLQPIMTVPLISELFLKCFHLCFSSLHPFLESVGGIPKALDFNGLIFKSVRCGSDDRATVNPALMLIAAAEAYQTSSINFHTPKHFYDFFVFHVFILSSRS